MRQFREGIGVFIMWLGVGVMLIGCLIAGEERFNRELDKAFNPPRDAERDVHNLHHPPPVEWLDEEAAY